MSDTCTACGAPDHADTVRLTDEGFCAAGLSIADAYAQLQKMFRPDPWPMESDTLREREDYTDAEWAAVPAGAHFLMGGRECTKLGDIDPGWSVYANANTLRAKAEAACGCARCQGHKYPQGGRCAIAPRIEAALREVVREIADLGFPWYTDFYGDCDDCGAAPSWAVGGGTHKPGCDLDIPNKIRAHYGLGDA